MIIRAFYSSGWVLLPIQLLGWKQQADNKLLSPTDLYIPDLFVVKKR